MNTIAQENAAARARAGVRTVTHAQLEALKNSTPTSRTAQQCDVYTNPPDGYALALQQLAAATPAPATTPRGRATPTRRVPLCQ